MDDKLPKNDPPYWLEVGDENWGPTDMRKRKSRPIPRPEMPTLSYGEGVASEWVRLLHIIAWVAIVLLLGGLIYWLRE